MLRANALRIIAGVARLIDQPHLSVENGTKNAVDSNAPSVEARFWVARVRSNDFPAAGFGCKNPTHGGDFCHFEAPSGLSFASLQSVARTRAETETMSLFASRSKYAFVALGIWRLIDVNPFFITQAVLRSLNKTVNKKC
jgi:hypothetical protein